MRKKFFSIRKLHSCFYENVYLSVVALNGFRARKLEIIFGFPVCQSLSYKISFSVSFLYRSISPNRLEKFDYITFLIVCRFHVTSFARALA